MRGLTGGGGGVIVMVRPCQLLITQWAIPNLYRVEQASFGGGGTKNKLAVGDLHVCLGVEI